MLVEGELVNLGTLPRLVSCRYIAKHAHRLATETSKAMAELLAGPVPAALLPERDA